MHVIERDGNAPTQQGWGATDVYVALAYLCVAVVTLTLFKTVAMWPASGVAFAAALMVGGRAWRGVFVGSILSNLTWAFLGGTSIFTLPNLVANLGIGIGNALAAVAGSRALRASIGNRNPFDSPLDALRFCFWGAGAFAFVTTAIGGGTNQLWNAPLSILNWFVNNLVGVIVIAPVILLWRQRHLETVTGIKAVEVGAVVVLALVLSVVLFGPFYSWVHPSLRLESLLLIPLFWGAARFDQRINASLTAASFFVVWWGTAAGHGLYAQTTDAPYATIRVQILEGSIGTILLISSAMYNMRRRAEEAVRASQQRLQSIIDKSPAIIYLKDLQGQYVLVNRRYEELHHIAGTDILGKTDYDVFPPENAAAFQTLDQEVLSAGSAREVEELVPLNDGLHTFISVKFPLDDSSGKPYAVCGISTDITERKRAEDAVRRSEEKYRSIVEDALEGISQVSLDGRMLAANPACARMLGYDSVEELLATVSDARQQLYVRPLERDTLVSALTAGGASAGREVEFRRKDGGTLWASISARLVRDDDGLPLFVETFASDISERKRAEAELKRHQDHLEELVAARTAELAAAKRVAEVANQAKSGFLASMSHELRTPLNGVLGFAQILQRDASLTQRQRLGLETIQHSGEHLLALINDILDLAKVEAGKLDLVCASMEMSAFVRVVADVTRVKAEEKGLLFQCDIASDLPSTVRADERRLRQVLLNLASNAVKFTDRGTVSLRVRTVSHGTSETLLRFEVEDSGVGIDPEHLARIFLPFEQLGDANRRSRGTGLGLAISRQLIHLMGSDIHVESQPGQGSRFWFDLRLQAADTPKVSSSAHAQIAGYEGPRRHVLVADDVAANRAVIVDLLQSLGFSVTEVADGEDLLKQAAASPPDLIISDVVMPRIDGLQATRQVKRSPMLRSVPVLLVSASVSGVEVARYLDAGADAFLPKPIDMDHLLQQISDMLQLTWKFDPFPHEGHDALALAAPPLQTLQALAEIAKRGDMREIRAAADRLSALGKQHQPFANRLRYLAEHFESRAITQLIQQFLAR